MKCLIVKCSAEAPAGAGMCPQHDHYYRVVLADPKYRSQPCPPAPKGGPL